MENSKRINCQLHNFLRDNRSKNQVSTEFQLKCSNGISDGTPETISPSSNSYFQVSTKPGPDSLTQVTVTEVRKTQFLTSSSTLDRLLSFGQDSILFRGGDSQEFRLLSSQQDCLPFGGEIARGCRNNPLVCLPDSRRGGETQNMLLKVPENEPIELNLGRSISPSLGFHKKIGPTGASVIPEAHFLPSHQDSSISLSREAQKEFHAPQTSSNNKDESSSSRNISPPKGFSDENDLDCASAKIGDLNEENNDQNRAHKRIRSLPHPKNGPYECPQCLTIHPTSQHYAAHVSARHGVKTPGGKKKRDAQKLKTRKHKMVRSPDGLTLIRDQSPNSIDDEVEVVLRCNIQSGVVSNQETRSPVREKRKHKTTEPLREPYVPDLSKWQLPEEEVSSSSGNDYKRNPNWKGPFGYLKRTKPS